MNQIKTLRFAALSLSAVLLTAVLTACGGSGSRSTTTTGTSSTPATTTTSAATSSDTQSGSDIGNGTGTGTGASGGIDGILNGTNDASTGTGSSNSNQSGSSDSSGSGVLGDMLPGMESIDLSNATIRFNGTDYRVSAEEELRRDEIGVQLMVVQQTVDKPEKDGDATGLPEGVKVWSIKNNTDYSAVAVEVDGMFYRANQQAE